MKIVTEPAGMTKKGNIVYNVWVESPDGMTRILKARCTRNKCQEVFKQYRSAS